MPKRSMISLTLRMPVRLDATWARKSPAVSRFDRIWARTSRKHVVDYFPALDELHRRDDDAFLEHLLERAHRRRRSPSDVNVVRQAGRVPGQLAVPVDRPDEADVVEVNAAAVRVVGEDHVARSELVHPWRLMARGTCSTKDPRWTGWVKAWAMTRMSGSK